MQERILVWESEVRRLKAQLAANANKEDLMLFFMHGNIEDVKYIDSLRDRLRFVPRHLFSSWIFLKKHTALLRTEILCWLKPWLISKKTTQSI